MSLRAAVPPAGQAKGTSTNDNASAGNVGEFVTATLASAGSALTTATALTLVSISLTAGDWDISGVVDFLPAAATSVTQLAASVSLTTNVLSGQAGGAGLGTDPTVLINQAVNVPTAQVGVPIPPVRLSIAVTTTVFLVASLTFTVSTATAFGTIRARRVR